LEEHIFSSLKEEHQDWKQPKLFLPRISFSIPLSSERTSLILAVLASTRFANISFNFSMSMSLPLPTEELEVFDRVDCLASDSNEDDLNLSVKTFCFLSLSIMKKN